MHFVIAFLHWFICFLCIISGIPITDPNFYATISHDKLAHVFRSDTDYEIPLLEERLQSIQEAGKVLLKKYEGKFENVIKQSEKSAQALLRTITQEFTSYRYTVYIVYQFGFFRCLYISNRNRGKVYKHHRGGVAQSVARLTLNVEVVGSSPIKGPRCFLDQETLPLLLSTGWFQERIRAWIHNRNKLRALWKIDLNQIQTINRRTVLLCIIRPCNKSGRGVWGYKPYGCTCYWIYKQTHFTITSRETELLYV